METPVYAIGDLHGQLGLLRAAHARIAADGGRDARIVHLGDLVDRGPDSAGVIRLLMDGQDAGRPWVVLKGNHDRFLARYLADPDWIDPCLSRPVAWADHPSLGAGATLASFGVDPALPPADRARAARAAAGPAIAAWLDALPLWHLAAGALFVHAGVRPGMPLRAQTEDDLVWIRAPFLTSGADHGALVVHGHTVVDAPLHCGNRLALDTGAAYGGPLTAVRIDAGGVALLTGTGPVPLRPEPTP